MLNMFYYMMYFYLSGMIMLNLSIIMLINGMFLMNFKNNIFMEWNILMFNSMNMNMYMLIDWMSMMFIFIVLLISSMIMFYCCEYMLMDFYKIRFFFILFMFIFSMIVLIVSPNMLSIIIGWDLLGFTSYALVIYYQNNYCYNSGMLVFILNRVGDLFLIMSISMMFIYGSYNFLNFSKLNFFILSFIVIMSFTKSAQFPFSSWLPAAMAAPTPVSCLVHSSTLVTSGIYLLIRFNYLINKFIYLMKFIMLISMITMMMAGFSAMFEFDIKKIIAFSTLSQLGLMFLIYSMNMYMMSYFHLIIHALFKSMMFMCSGILIHSMINYQDIRKINKIKEFMPFTSMMILISLLCLCGLPFMSGFYSKDKILESMFYMHFSLFNFLMFMMSMILTLFYSIRMIKYLFNMNFKFLSLSMIKDSKIMNFSMIILMVLSIIFGNMINWLMFNNIEENFLMIKEKMMIIYLYLIMLILFIFINKMNKKKKNMFMYFLGKMYFYYNFNKMFNMNFLNFSKFILKNIDKNWMEYFFKKFMLLSINNLNLINLNMNYLIYMMYLLMIMIIMFMFL